MPLAFSPGWVEAHGANGERLAKLLPRTRLVALQNTGHLPFLEDPDHFRELLAAHLGGQRSSRT
jgi:pimeloyl-ACP methyl ester carboxylesterase